MSSTAHDASSPLPTLRIAYFGLPIGALALARAGFTPVTIALGHPDAPGARRVRRRLSRHALVLAAPNLDDDTIAHTLASARPDVLLSWFWPWRIPERVLSLAPRGGFGAHPSLLPRWRGPDPYFWALYAGDAETGVTLHRLAREYDTGNVVDRRVLPVRDSDNAWTLAKRLDRPGLELLVECARRLAHGETLEGTPQDDAAATDAPRPDDDLLAIDWHRPAADIVRLVRASAPLPGAAAELDDEVVEVLAASVFPRPLPKALEPADAVLAPEGVVIRAAHGGVLLERVRTEDGRHFVGQAVADLFNEPPFALQR